MSSRRNSFLGTLAMMAIASTCGGQELFIMNEPASSVPKNVLGLRFYYHNFKENDTPRRLYGLRAMYGLTSRLSLYANGSIANHHNVNLPPDLINHTHTGNNTTYYASRIRRGGDYPYLFTGVNLMAKYRFLSIDRKYEHFRMAVYGEWSNTKVAHDEAEPNLQDDTAGYGGGLITTYLKKRFAVSLTTGVIIPESYSEYQEDITGGPDLWTTIEYGRALKYNLSFGYRYYPKKYGGDYQQPNWNAYLEFTGRTFETGKVFQDYVPVPIRTVSFVGMSYVEVTPGVQKIINSNTRVELSCTISFIRYSVAHFPLAMTFAVQHYFYRKDKTNEKRP